MAFNGKIALITGAGSGMGQLAAWRLADAGIKVAAFDISEKGLAKTAEGKPNIRTYVVDVTSTESVNAAVAQVEKELGPIDRVINAAAIMPFGKLLDQPTEQIHRLMAINFGGLVNVSKATLPAMLKRGKGDFISFSSMLGQMPTLMTGAYAATKFAVSCYTEVLYHENRNKGVRFICVCPPAVKTPLLQQAIDTVWPKILDENPPIKPEEVLDAVEVSLEKGDFWCMPGKGTRLGYIMRRLLPGAVWKAVHKAEGF
ncbi:MAG: SDR family oxidoreductase [Sterolibacterium sp.]|nr:SDR family oxidoreductase [Sterolibacterium sp.]MBP9798807.1 SDR family oxidoreductase [Sterolibacterium sp.]